jgi:hypothetical protein
MTQFGVPALQESHSFFPHIVDEQIIHGIFSVTVTSIVSSPAQKV